MDHAPHSTGARAGPSYGKAFSFWPRNVGIAAQETPSFVYSCNDPFFLMFTLFYLDEVYSRYFGIYFFFVRLVRAYLERSIYLVNSIGPRCTDRTKHIITIIFNSNSARECGAIFYLGFVFQEFCLFFHTTC